MGTLQAMRVAYAIGSALMTIGSVIGMMRQAQHFTGRVKHYNRPQYTKRR